MKTATATRTSSVGFDSQTKSCSQYVNNFIKQSRLAHPDHILWQQEAWFMAHPGIAPNCSIQELLQCEHSDLTYKSTPNSEIPLEYQKYVQNYSNFTNGFWNISCQKNIRENRHEFTIDVNCGGSFSFHPKVIKDGITQKYGHMIYETWRSMILDDLPCLEQLVRFVRSKITFVAPSVVCSHSSARLCRRVGIPVRNDIAFLFPSGYA